MFGNRFLFIFFYHVFYFIIDKLMPPKMYKFYHVEKDMLLNQSVLKN